MGDTEVDLAVLIRPAKEADARFQVDQRQLVRWWMWYEGVLQVLIL